MRSGTAALASLTMNLKFLAFLSLFGALAVQVSASPSRKEPCPKPEKNPYKYPQCSKNEHCHKSEMCCYHRGVRSCPVASFAIRADRSL